MQNLIGTLVISTFWVPKGCQKDCCGLTWQAAKQPHSHSLMPNDTGGNWGKRKINLGVGIKTN